MSAFNYSFEFFPPKTDNAARRLHTALNELEKLSPEFVSVTYGAGGTTRERTFKTVADIQKQRKLTPATHLTCVGASRAEIDEIIEGYLETGVQHFVALRGDPPGAVNGVYEPRDDGYAYGADLVGAIRKQSAEAKISVSAYPERHPESADWAVELDNLQRKVDAGANNAITQFFFHAGTFLQFRDRVADAGINIPIIPGIMLQPNFAGLCKMSDMCGVDVPRDWRAAYETVGDDTQAREDLTVRFATELVRDLMGEGVEDFHFYTLNASEIVKKVIQNIQSD